MLIPVPPSVAASVAAIASGVPAPPALDARQPLLDVPLDHLAQQQARLHDQPWPTAVTRPHGVAEDAREGGDVAGQPVHAHQQGGALGAGPHPLDQTGNQRQVPLGAHLPAQPQAERHGQRQGHPDLAPDDLHPQLVGLDMPQVHPPLLHQVLVHPLAVRPGPRLPGGDGALVQPEGGDDGLERAAVAEQSQHQRHQVRSLLEPVEGRVPGRGEGPATAPARVPPLLPAMDGDVVLPDPASGRTGGVVAELSLRVHRAPPADAIAKSRPYGCPMDPHFSTT